MKNLSASIHFLIRKRDLALCCIWNTGLKLQGQFYAIDHNSDQNVHIKRKHRCSEKWKQSYYNIKQCTVSSFCLIRLSVVSIGGLLLVACASVPGRRSQTSSISSSLWTRWRSWTGAWTSWKPSKHTALLAKWPLTRYLIMTDRSLTGPTNISEGSSFGIDQDQQTLQKLIENTVHFLIQEKILKKTWFD